MGREIRRVPPNWEHPKDENGDYKSMHDQTYEDAAKEWMAGYEQWQRGEHEALHGEYKTSCKYYWEYDYTPDESLYRPAFTKDPTWWQVYQTVSEGSPVTPPFATKEELIAYLAEKGDFWDQDRGHGGCGYEAAKAFVESGWAPSFVVNTSRGEIKGSYEALV